jgi:nucleotide-binding universal stress UspA family protein
MGEMVVGYDGSDCAKAALLKAIELAQATGDGIAVVFGYEPPSVRAGGPVGYQRDLIEEMGKTRIAEAMAMVEGTGVAATSVEIEELPADALIAVAADRGASMIVIGNRGESPVLGAILGSTAYKLLHRTTIPVLVVPAAG